MTSYKDHCDICGTTLNPKDFEKGRAVILLKKAWCRPCGDRMVERSKTKRLSKPTQDPPLSRTSTPSKVTALAAAGPFLNPGDHACAAYSSEAERARQVACFLSQGLRNREKVIYAVDEASPKRVLGYLETEGLPADSYLQSGQLEIHSTQTVYAPSGGFDPSEMIARIKILCDQAAREGYSGLRGTGEMTWALRGWPGSERLVEYELRLTAALAGGRCIALCQYDASQVSPALLHQIKAVHPVMVPSAAS